MKNMLLCVTTVVCAALLHGSDTMTRYAIKQNLQQERADKNRRQPNNYMHKKKDPKYRKAFLRGTGNGKHRAEFEHQVNYELDNYRNS